MKIPLPPSSLTGHSAGDSSAFSSLMDTTSHSPVLSPSDIYGKLLFPSPVHSHRSRFSDVMLRDSLPVTSATSSSNNRTDRPGTSPWLFWFCSHSCIHLDNPPASALYSYNHELLTNGNYPVYMSQQTFFRMLYTPDGHQWSKLESFLASSILVRQFAKGVTEPFDTNNLTVSGSFPCTPLYPLQTFSLGSISVR